MAIDRALMHGWRRAIEIVPPCHAILDWALDCVEQGPPAGGIQSPSDSRRFLSKISAAAVDIAYLVYRENHSIIAERFSSHRA